MKGAGLWWLPQCVITDGRPRGDGRFSLPRCTRYLILASATGRYSIRRSSLRRTGGIDHERLAQNEAEIALGSLLEAERSRAEQLMNGLRLVILLLLGAAAVIYAPTLPRQLWYAHAAVLVPMLVWSLFQVVLVRRRGGTYPRWLSSASPLADATAVTAILLCYGFISAPEVALKAPVTLMYFAMLAARPMTGSAKDAALTSIVIVVEYGVAFAWLATATPLRLSVDPIIAARSSSVSMLDEGMKLVLLAVAGAVATYATAWHERVLRRALASQVARGREERELAMRLQEADKLAALGTLSASIAHEVSNPLTSIALTAEMLQRRSSDSETQSEAAAIAADARRTAAVVRDLLVFARNDEVIYEAVSLAEVVERGLGTLRYFLRDRGVVVEHRCGDDVPSVHANGAALERVIINLVINAAQAMETHRGARLVRITTGRTVESVQIVVEDTGPGFAPGVADRIFERFFTTKPAGTGTGLGLWMAAQVVGSHGGSIAASDTGSGARFVITLPLTREASAA